MNICFFSACATHQKTMPYVLIFSWSTNELVTSTACWSIEIGWVEGHRIEPWSSEHLYGSSAKAGSVCLAGIRHARRL